MEFKEEWRRFVNNLINVTPANPAFPVWARRVWEVVSRRFSAPPPPNLNPQLWIAAGDTFFLHYSAFPVLRADNPDSFLTALLAAFREYVATDEYRRARALTQYNDTLSLIFASSFLSAFLEALAQRQQQQKEGEQGEGRDMGSGSAAGATPQQGEHQRGSNQQGEGQSSSASPSAQLPAEVVKEAASTALRRAVKDVEAAADALSFFGGKEAGKETADVVEVAGFLSELLSVHNARDLFSFARRLADGVPLFVRVARERSLRGDEVYGYRRTTAVERALPRELALPDELFLYRLASGGLLSREYATLREGAYYVLIDKSESMAGQKTLWARSVATALLKLAQRKRRKYFLRFFDVDVYPAASNPPLSNPRALLHALVSIPPSGGTSIDTALATALEDLSRFKLAEYTNTIIIVTDGEDRVTIPADEFRSRGCVLTAVMIEGHNAQLEELARKTGGQLLTARLTREGALKLIEKVK